VQEFVVGERELWGTSGEHPNVDETMRDGVFTGKKCSGEPEHWKN